MRSLVLLALASASVTGATVSVRDDPYDKLKTRKSAAVLMEEYSGMMEILVRRYHAEYLANDGADLRVKKARVERETNEITNLQQKLELRRAEEELQRAEELRELETRVVELRRRRSLPGFKAGLPDGSIETEGDDGETASGVDMARFSFDLKDAKYQVPFGSGRAGVVGPAFTIEAANNSTDEVPEDEVNNEPEAGEIA